MQKKFLRTINIFLLFLVAFAYSQQLSAQKVAVSIVRSVSSSLTFWQVLDDRGNQVMSANGNLDTDSVSFSLPAEKIFSLIIISKDTTPVPVKYDLTVDSNLIVRIEEPSFTGEKGYRFYTGQKRQPSKIIGGSAVDISIVPWQVFFRAGNYLCGGTIIAPDWILTAAHCVVDANGVDISISDMTVVAGTNTPLSSWQGKTFSVGEVFKHEGFSRSALLNDIALLHLSGRINLANARPVAMISALDVFEGATLPGVIASVTGWGLTSATPRVEASSLNGVQLPLVSNDQAKEIWGDLIPSTSMMAGYKNGRKNSCSGDSGGPLIVEVMGEPKVAGVVSWGSTSCDTYSGFTRISYFRSWIEEKTGIKDFWPGAPAGLTKVCNPGDTTIYNIEAYDGATGYEWSLYPAGSGIATGNGVSGTVKWSPSFHGYAKVLVKAIAYDQTSNWARTTILVSPEIAISSFPSTLSQCANTTATLRVQATGYNIGYKWYFNGNNLASQSSNFLSLPALTSANSGIYHCDISDDCKTVSAHDISMTVLPLTTISTVSPATYTVIGDSPQLEVNASGDNLQYQWQKDGKDISGGNDKTLSLFDVNANDIGQYRVIVSGTCGTVTSDSIYLYVRNGQTSASDGIMVWPTVASDYFNIAPGSDEPYDIRLYSDGGSLVRELRNCRYRTSLYAGNLSSGVYVIKIIGNRLTSTFRVIKTQ